MRRSSIAVAASLGGASAIALVVLVALTMRAARSPPSTRDGAVDPDTRSEATAGPAAPAGALDRAPEVAGTAWDTMGSGPWTIVGRVVLCANPRGHRDPSPAGAPVPAEGRGERAAGEDAAAAPDEEPPHEPVPGALVSVRRTASPDDPPSVPDGTAAAPALGTAPPEATAITGLDGRFELRGAPRDAWVEVSVDRPASALWRQREELGEPENPPRLDLGEILLLPAATLVVEVVGPEGEPVSDARVQAVQRDVPTLPVPGSAAGDGARAAGEKPGPSVPADTAGVRAFRFERLAPGLYRVDALAPGHALASEEITLPRDEPLRIELARGWGLRGRVLDEGGEPLAGAVVSSMEDDSGFVLTRTDVEGRFVLEGIDGYPLWVEAVAPGHVADQKELRPGWASDFRLLRESAIEGKVVAQTDRRALSGVRIRAVPDGPGVLATGKSDARGDFRIGGLSAGAYDLLPDQEPWLAVDPPRVQVSGGQSVDEVLVVVGEGFSRTVNVLEAGTLAPVGDLEVVLEQPGKRPLLAVKREATTGRDGTCRVGGLRDGPFTLRVATDGFLAPDWVRGVLASAEGSDIVLRLDPRATVCGRVLDPQGGPIPRARVSIRLLTPEGLSASSWMSTLDGSTRRLVNQAIIWQDRELSTDADGRFAYRGLPFDASYFVRAERDGFGDAWTEEIRLSRDRPARDVDIVLTTGGAIQGRVFDARGYGIRGAWVAAKRDLTTSDHARESRCPLAGSTLEVERTARSDSDGAYELRALPAGSYRVSVGSDGRVAPEERAVDVREGAIAGNVDFVCPAGASLAGRVLDRTGAPVSGAIVNAARVASPGGDVRASTDDDGTFLLEGLQEGTLFVSAEVPWADATTVRAIVPGPPLEIRLDAGAIVTGRITARDGRQCDGSVFVQFRRNPTEPWREYSEVVCCDPVGRYEVWAPSGPGCVTLRGDGLASVRLDVILAAGETRRLDAELAAARRIEGHVLDRATGAAVVGVEVRCDAGGSWQIDETDAAGEFDLEVAAGPFEILAIHEAFRPGRASGVVAAGVEVTSVVVELEAGPSIHGLVTIAGAPVAGAVVRIRGKEGSVVAEVRAGPDGLYDAPALAPGIYEVSAAGTVEGDRRLETRIEAEVPESGIARLDVDLLAVRASGRVLLDGRPVRGARVAAFVDRGDALDVVETGADGRWSLLLRRGERHVLAATATADGGGERIFEVEVPEEAAEVRRDLELGADE